MIFRFLLFFRHLDINVCPVGFFVLDDDELELDIFFSLVGFEGELGLRLVLVVGMGDGLAIVLRNLFEVLLVQSPFAFGRFSIAVLELKQIRFDFYFQTLTLINLFLYV